MSGGVVPDGRARVRIKGHAASVIRFFFISVSFMMAWVLITSELGYYSKWFGPQILLELSLAFYFPSIPVLILSGSLEKVLDAKVGPVMSMAGRLVAGLTGCVVCCAAFPFLPTTHSALLWLTATIGVLSAVAFSTSYQLVQWFRNADVIALGVGGVGTGPLVLLLQQCLAMRPLPRRWQWIAQFEITAAIMAIGLFSAISLFAQYWKIMTGEEEYREPSTTTTMRSPLLGADGDAEGGGAGSGQTEEEAAAAAKEAAGEEGVMALMRCTTERIVLTPDPFHALPLVLPPDAFEWEGGDEEGSGSAPRLHRAHSISGCVDLAHHPESSGHDLAALAAEGHAPGGESVRAQAAAFARAQSMRTGPG
eukprot:CAMPEP_0202872354 /NCGR_PEP_ID=MMETSP1391-20130828/21020_1 /ASSEMBLY_ACC=CAM_ASM_000867 /TAXON_ID=1034604 /ORGANISM="Chlamydomonas leiostraca, Strain SAG 11-49" /LENGTH=364 /DNA_ID=CAMNT_0049553379 /DNA_START=39 /DNA_END=1129 /DNA_ORIENTATION=+